jgi:Subtilase family
MMKKFILSLTIVLSSTLPILASAQATKGIDSQPTTQGGNNGGRGGFGLSLDLGFIIRGVQSLFADERYEAPEISKLPQYEIGQLILSWPRQIDAIASPAIDATGGILIMRSSLENLGMTIAVVNYPNDAQAKAAMTSLRAINSMMVADRHAIAYPLQVPVASPAKHYAHDLLKASSQAGAKLPIAIVIGIVDTDVSNSASLALASFKSKRVFPESDKPALADHGNGVAAVLAATGNGFEGLAQGAHLRSASVMRELAPGINASNTALIALGLDWLAGEKVSVMNLSIGAAHDAVLAGVIAKVQALGIVVVAAAGNGGPEAPPTFPAAYPGVIAATAVDANKRTYRRANRGAYVGIAAPGVDVWLPVAEKGNKGKYMSGTSFAAPFVAAAVAQAMAQQTLQQNQPSNAASNAYLQNLCGKASNLGAPGNEHGCGLLQM